MTGNVDFQTTKRKHRPNSQTEQQTTHILQQMEDENLICIAARATLINFKYSFRPIECRVTVSLVCSILTRGNLIRFGMSKKVPKICKRPHVY